MITTHKVKDGKSSNQAFDKHCLYLSENVASRLTSVSAYQDILAQTNHFKRSERKVVLIAAITSVAVTIGVVRKKNTGFSAIEIIDTWFIVSAVILGLLFLVALYNHMKLDKSIVPAQSIAIDGADVLESYFVDFVEERVPLIADENSDLVGISAFKISTKADDKKLRIRDITLSGFCHYKNSVIEQSLMLEFSADYRSLTVKKYDQVVPLKEVELKTPTVSS